jgi:phage terminase small subunit
VSESDLTPKQERFVEEYLVDLNATQAAIRAGYSEDSAKSIGCENLTKPNVQDAIAEARASLSARTGVTQERVIAELAKIGFANMQNYMRTTTDGDPYLDFSALTEEQSAALSEVTVDDYVDGRGEDARAVKRVKFKLHDKRAALVDLGRHLGAFPTKVEITGKDGETLLAPAIAISFNGGGPGYGGAVPNDEDEDPGTAEPEA